MNLGAQICLYLQCIGKNEGAKKPVISSIKVSSAKLHVSAIYQSFWYH
jgi:hypothetical protein